MTEQEIYESALKQWGFDFQADMAVEEMAEFIQALNHLRRGRGSIEDLYEEHADCTIMLRQLAQAHPDLAARCLAWKLDRLKRKAESGDYNLPKMTLEEFEARSATGLDADAFADAFDAWLWGPEKPKTLWGNDAPPAPSARPKIVCLCGSTRFRADFERANAEESLAGNIVLSVGMFGHEMGLDMTGVDKKNLDRLHFRKIELADEVLLVHPDYIGLSTCDEFHYALALGKPIRVFAGPFPAVAWVGLTQSYHEAGLL